MARQGKIAFFDSGIGGLTALAAVRAALPEYDYVYLGDTVRAPYGNRTQDEIYDFTKQAVLFLKEKGCTLVIVACNTASAEALKRLQAELAPERDSFRILGILAPLVESALEQSKSLRIGVMATQSTVSSGAYTREIIKRCHTASIHEVACPKLVPLIESGNTLSDEMYCAIESYVKPLVEHKVDIVILGCTHYGHVAHTIRRILPEHVSIVYEEHCIGDKTRDYLERHPQIQASLATNKTLLIYTTKLTTAFTVVVSELFETRATEITL